MVTFYELSDPSVYNQSNCGTKVTSTLTLMVNLDLHNKRLACLSYNRTYIERFEIADLSELFVVSDPNNEKVPDFQFSFKAVLWISIALIIFLLGQQITGFTSSSTGEEVTGFVGYTCNSCVLLLHVPWATSVTAIGLVSDNCNSFRSYSYVYHGYNCNLEQQLL
ncbi:hypothetical protein PoB_006692800 [Plakobranchus ocellatus]|uniref:Uncharacterized protein n=1 Tax=Plakobranchus ocellatus TaxID=259542 RepID=A0AAV4D858_9GAST|nr:hypothetical protein PoB_006692800 [Plakobranchus ocellatus]